VTHFLRGAGIHFGGKCFSEKIRRVFDENFGVYGWRERSGDN